MRDNVPCDPNVSLTLREERIIRQILTMATHSTHPRSIIALQEVNSDVYAELQKHLPSTYTPIAHHDNTQGDVLFYDQDIFECLGVKSNVYGNAKNTWMIVTLKDRENGKIHTIIHSHVPGGPKSEQARNELARKIMHHLDRRSITVIMSDQNCEPEWFQKDLREVARKMHRCNPFITLFIPYPTHVNTKKEACRIDNLFIAGPISKIESYKVSKTANEFFKEMQGPLDLFQEIKSAPHILYRR